MCCSFQLHYGGICGQIHKQTVNHVNTEGLNDFCFLLSTFEVLFITSIYLVIVETFD